MATHSVRRAAVAGHFYPADAPTLSAQVHSLLARASPLLTPPAPKALIVPHAGYIYSGPIAASAYALLAPLSDVIRRVVLVGPSHRVSFPGIALPRCAAFATPLGEVELDSEAIFSLAQGSEIVFDDAPHAQEHALEVQLPFLQSVLQHFRIVPLCLGRVSPETVAEVLDALWGGPETLIVASSDLSHFNPYLAAQRDDRASVEQILALSPTLSCEQACGATSINALLHAAQAHPLQAHLLDLRNSGDTAGDRSRVVGYAAVSFSRQTHMPH